MTEALGKSYRPKISKEFSWTHWLFGVDYTPGANVWENVKGFDGRPDEDIHLLEYPSFWYIHLGPFVL